MAAESGRRDPGVEAELYARPYAFDFFQAVRLLRLLQARAAAAGAPAGREAVRYRTLLSLETPASSIYALERAPAERPGPPSMTVTFLGLTGPMGALPVQYTELLLERRFRYRDSTAHDFLDIFNHRLISLFFEAWEKYHLLNDYERGVRDRFFHYLLDLVGLGTRGLQGRLRGRGAGVGDQSLVYYSGLLAQRPHSAAALRAMLSDYFRVPVEVVQFVGRWLHLTEDDCTRLGERRQALGEGAMLGSQLWDQQSKFRLRVGPLTRAQFKDFLPSGKGFLALIRLAQFHVGNTLDFDVQLVLRRQEVAHCVLGAADPDQARLGWSTWLRAAPFSRDADDPVFVVGRQRQRWATARAATAA